MAFTENDGELFRKLGRESYLTKLLGLVLDNQIPMIIIRGASGAGKTSLLRAGLTHILADKSVIYHYWEATPTEPEKWLLHAIRETWPSDTTKPETFDELINLSEQNGRQQHVIILDQFEQLRNSKSIFRLLRKIIHEVKPPHRITWVIAFRREFSADWMDFFSPQQERGALSPPDLSLDLFTPEQAREVISQLIRESNLSVEEAVVTNLIEAAVTKGKISPVDIGIGLMVLTEMQEQQLNKTITIRDYQFAGGAEGLMTQYISRCLELFSEESKDKIINALLELCDPETLQRIAEGLSVDELATKVKTEARLLKRQLDRLAKRDIRLVEVITPPGNSSDRYRLPHERLIPALYRLKGKLLAEVDQTKRKFENAFNAWQKDGKRSRYLLKGKDLRLVERYKSKIHWEKNVQDKLQFLNQSIRRRRFVRGGAIASVVVLIGLGWFMSERIQRDVAEKYLIANDYPKELYDWQRNLKKLALVKPMNLATFPVLYSDSIEELELQGGLESTSIAGLAALSRCSSLKKLTLDLSGSKVTDLEPISKLTNLNQLNLNLYNSNVSNLDSLSKINNLNQLNLALSLSKMSNLDSLSKINNLNQLTLTLSDSNVKNLDSLSKINNLNQLNLSLNLSNVSSLDSLSNLTNLEEITFDLPSKVRDLNWIPKLTRLKKLVITEREPGNHFHKIPESLRELTF